MASPAASLRRAILIPFVAVHVYFTALKDQQKGKAGRNARDTRGPTEQASAKLQAKNAPKVKGHENGWTAPAAQKHQLDTEDLKRIFRSVPPSSAPPADTILGSLGHDFQLPVPRSLETLRCCGVRLAFFMYAEELPILQGPWAADACMTVVLGAFSCNTRWK